MSKQPKKQSLDERLLKLTEKQNKRLKDFSFMTSHNVRVLVANLLPLANMITPNEGEEDLVKMIQSIAERLEETVVNINQYLILEQKDLQSKLHPVHLGDAVYKALHQLNTSVERFEVDVTAAIPSSIHVIGIEHFVINIMIQLLRNAFRFSEENAIARVQMLAIEHDDQVVLTIQDNGLGLDIEKYQDKLFTLGSRFHPERSEGMGLGLYLSKFQMEAMCGTIAIESTPQLGTTITLQFKKAKPL
ncbi:HAMP domain-containing sensor histidine kinase [Spongiivirga sp. MCCC 1A20706]|uniref:sensor histidine kinase n=1 Tax=Spongiivirga sp. MCCC 1A20706 TaxID=3160963 RepID=UPI0039778A38